MLENIEVSKLLPASVERIYNAWLDSEQHGSFTGGEADIDPQVGGKFTAWNEYIEGVTLQLEPFHRIVQSWRSSEFPPESSDSQLEVILQAIDEQTLLTLIHTNIPIGQGQQYKQGWIEHYFIPMEAYFTENE